MGFMGRLRWMVRLAAGRKRCNGIGTGADADHDADWDVPFAGRLVEASQQIGFSVLEMLRRAEHAKPE